MVSIVRQDSETFAALLHDMETRADARKHETVGEESIYWQGRADALRGVLVSIPAFLYTQDDYTRDYRYDDAKRLLGYLTELYNERRQNDDQLLDEIHDIQAFLQSTDEMHGRVTPHEVWTNVRARIR